MRAPSINLARRPFRNNTVYYAVFATCLLLLLSASVYNIYDFFSRGDDLAALESDLAARTEAYKALYDEVEGMKREVKKLSLTTINARSSFANQLLLSRFFSWSLLFDRLEEIIPPEVKIRSIRPSISPKGIEIQIDGLARTAEVLYEFEDNLDQSNFFANVYPESENSRETRNEINFDLIMKYIPAGVSRPEEKVVSAATEAPAPAGETPPGEVEPASGDVPPEPEAAGAEPGQQEGEEADIAAEAEPAGTSDASAAGQEGAGENPPGAAVKPAAKAGPLETAAEIPKVTSPEDVLRNLGIPQWGKAKGKGKGKAKAEPDPPADEDEEGDTP